jgi:hypothetical protein
MWYVEFLLRDGTKGENEMEGVLDRLHYKHAGLTPRLVMNM